MVEHNFTQSSLNIQPNMVGPFWPNAKPKHSGSGIGSVIYYPGPLKVPQDYLRPLRTHKGQLGPMGLLDVPMDVSRS